MERQSLPVVTGEVVHDPRGKGEIVLMPPIQQRRLRKAVW